MSSCTTLTITMKAERADDGSQRNVRADGEIDTACQDDQMLPHRHNRDDGGLGEDVAEVASRQEIGRQETENRNQYHQYDDRTGAQQGQA